MEIVRPPEHGDLQQVFFDLRGPYFGNTFEITSTKIVFDGYFRYESELFQEDRPVHRFFDFQGHTYVLAFVRKRTGKDTSNYWYDDEIGGDICLSPTEIIELDYRVVEKDPPKERWVEIIDMIRKECDILDDVNSILHKERIMREWEEQEKQWIAEQAKQACGEEAPTTSNI